jgi:hypothetical protein
MSPLDLITAPARLALAVAGRTAGVAIDALKGARGLLDGDEPDHAPPARPEGARNGTPTRPVTREPAQRPAPPPPAAEPPVEAERVEEEHVDEGTVLVAEVAEPGAEEGAGAQLEVEEPWDGYDRMKADEIVERLSTASREEVAAVQLYEAVNSSRSTVLEAGEKRLRDLMPPPAENP